MRRQGVDQDIVDAIGTGDLTKVKLSPKDRGMLGFVKLLTEAPSHTTDDDVANLRTLGWTDEEIWEMAFEVGIFSFLNRMADVHGLDYPATGWFPPQQRDKGDPAKLKQPTASIKQTNAKK